MILLWTYADLNYRCRCSAEFCYVCGVRWKDCTCAVLDEQMLYERGAHIAARDAGRNGAPNRARVQEAIRNIRENHDCGHGSWKRLDNHRGYDTHCEMCQKELNFINECRRCQLRACWRCINNRLR